MMEKVKTVKKQNILAQNLSSRKTKYIVGTVLLSGIGIALPRIFHVLAGASSGATFLPMHIAVLIAALVFGALSSSIVAVSSVIASFLLTQMPNLARLPYDSHLPPQHLGQGGGGVAGAHGTDLPEGVDLHGVQLVIVFDRHSIPSSSSCAQAVDGGLYLVGGLHHLQGQAVGPLGFDDFGVFLGKVGVGALHHPLEQLAGAVDQVAVLVHGQIAGVIDLSHAVIVDIVEDTHGQGVDGDRKSVV